MSVNNIRTARRKIGLTQSELAAKVGTKKQSISNWELGISVPSYPKLKKLSEVLEEEIDYLLEQVDDTPTV